MDNLPEKDNLPENKSEASPEAKPAKAKMSRKKKIIITISVILGILLTLVVAAAIGINYYIDHMLDYISYDTGEEEWSGVDIDASDYGIGEDFSYDLDFSDPEAPWGEESGDESATSGDESENSSEDISDDSSAGSEDSDPADNSKPTTSKPVSETSVKPTVSQKPYEPDLAVISGIFENSEINYEYDADIINILLIGADGRTNNGKGRSDTMIIMSINKTNKKIVFASLMRDLYVSIPGYKDNRLNAAHSAGGPSLLMKTIKANFGISIDYYVKVNFASFRTAVDAIGGIDITVNKDNYDYFRKFDEVKNLSKDEAIDGTRVIHIDGTVALAYARSRAFKGSDFTRTLHQRDLLSQFVKSCRNSSLSELHELLKTVLPYVSTNIPKDMLKMMVFEAIDYVSYDIESCRVPCAGSYSLETKRGMSVIVFDLEKNQKYLLSKIYG